MAFESVRSYVQLASGLGEMTKARAMEAAQGLLALPGADEVTRRAVQASTLADQLLEAAKANRANLMSLVQGEVEAALRKADVARLTDVEQAKAALATVSKELADLRALVTATGASAVSAAAARSGLGRGGAGSSGAVTTRHTAAPAAEPPRLHAAPDTGDGHRAAGAVAGGAGSSPATKKAAAKRATGSTAKKATAKKATAKKAATKKAPAAKSTASGPAANRTAAKKAATKATTPTAGKATAKKAAATSATGSTATKATAKKAAAKRATGSTAKKAAAKKATSTGPAAAHTTSTPEETS